MKIKLLLAVILLLVTVQLNAQERSAFRAGYLRLGINDLGDALDQGMSPIRNIFDSRYGASRGLALAFGRNYYIGGKDHKGIINVGLDWTMLSVNYNKLDKWQQYGDNSGAQTLAIGGKKIALSASTKLGPVISLNFIEKIVIDARFQFAPTLRFFDFDYSENQGLASERYFSFTNNSKEARDAGFNAESIKNRVSFGLASSFGLTLRRNALGLSADYISGDVKNFYDAINPNFGHADGKDRIPFHNVQLALNLTF